MRAALARLLTASSFEAKTYASAREFIDSIRIEIPQCLVVDIHMPEFSGLELQRYLARINQKIPTIVITAFDDAETRSRSSACGAFAVLTKPLRSSMLIDAIVTATTRHR